TPRPTTEAVLGRRTVVRRAGARLAGALRAGAFRAAAFRAGVAAAPRVVDAPRRRLAGGVRPAMVPTVTARRSSIGLPHRTGAHESGAGQSTAPRRTEEDRRGAAVGGRCYGVLRFKV